jgi:hypothetical protein
VASRVTFNGLHGDITQKTVVFRKPFHCVLHHVNRWVDNIKMDLREIGWDGVDWVDRAQDRDQWRALVNTVLNLRVP